MAADPEPAATQQLSVEQSRAEPPLRLLFIAVAWMLGAVLSGFVLPFVTGFVIGFHNALVASHGIEKWRLNPLIFRLLTTIPLQLVLFFAAWRQGRVVGQGDRRAGLGLGPLRRLRLLSVLAVTATVVAIGWALLLGRWLKPQHAFGIALYFAQARRLGSAAELVVLLLTVSVAPICEEMFFRGWLWAGLQRHWRPAPVMLATALPWLLLHATEGLERPLFLIPAAFVFSLARHWCGGSRASVLLHVINNGVAAVILVFLLWFR